MFHLDEQCCDAFDFAHNCCCRFQALLSNIYDGFLVVNIVVILKGTVFYGIIKMNFESRR